MQPRHINPMRTGFIAALVLGWNLVVLPAQDPFPQVPANGYYQSGSNPNGQPSNGNYAPGGYGQGPAIPSQPATPSRADGLSYGMVGASGSADSAGATSPVKAAPAYGPIYQSGQPPASGASATSYVGQSGSVHATTSAQAATAGELCPLAQQLGRVGDDVVLTGDALLGIDEMMRRVAGRMPPDKLAEQRAALVKEVTEGIHEFAAHASEPDPIKNMSMQRRMLLNQLIRQQIEVKMIYQDFLKTVPKEGLEQIKENVDRHFDDSQVKVLMKREKVATLADLENALHAKGSSLQRERRIFQEQFIAQQWASEKLKDKDGNEITHEDMIVWYKAHIKDFEEQPKVRWEELTVSFSHYPNHEQAYAALAALGNRVLAGASLAEVAKSGSDGLTARQGGQRDWIHKDSLNSETLNKALFALPVGQLSPILECQDGFYIIRVLERRDLTKKSFLDAQKEVKEKIEKEQFDKRYKEYVKTLQEKFPVWTVFDASLQQAEHNPDDDDRYSTH